MKNQKRMKGTKLERLINSIIDQHDKFKSSYFWRPPGNASGRRSYEKQNSRETVRFMFQGKLYVIYQNVDCSCKNVYYNFSLHVDSSKKNISTLKRLII